MQMVEPDLTTLDIYHDLDVVPFTTRTIFSGIYVSAKAVKTPDQPPDL